MSAPKVSVCITTYNHGAFIGEALDSVLAQKTDFDFEIIVGEDDSDDDTRKIVKDYAARFPERIRLLLNDRSNVIHIGGVPTGRWNFVNNLKHAKGEFIALLEGDDFWIDDSKLQRQVNLLEHHPECSFSFHNAWSVDYETGEKSSFIGLDDIHGSNSSLANSQPKESVEIQIQHLFFRWIVPTASIVFRKSKLDDLPVWFYQCISGDHTLQLWLAKNGNVMYLNRYMSVWRRHPGGLSRHCTGLFHQRNWARMHHHFNRHLSYAYDHHLAPMLAKRFSETSDMENPENESLRNAFNDLILSIFYSWRYSSKRFIRDNTYLVIRWVVHLVRSKIYRISRLIRKNDV